MTVEPAQRPVTVPATASRTRLATAAGMAPYLPTTAGARSPANSVSSESQVDQATGWAASAGLRPVSTNVVGYYLAPSLIVECRVGGPLGAPHVRHASGHR